MYAYPATACVPEYLFPWPPLDGFHLASVLTEWGLPEWLVSRYLTVFLINIDRFLSLILLGLLLGLLASRTADIAVVLTFLAMPVLEIQQQAKWNDFAGLTLRQTTLWALRGWLLPTLIVAFLIFGYWRFTLRRPNWGSAFQRELVAGIVLLMLFGVAYKLYPLIQLPLP